MNESHKTAIARRSISAPARAIMERGWLRGKRVLDFGCGRGMDADTLKCERYDPHWAPDMPEGLFDVVLCTYVFNVIPEEDEPALLRAIRAKLAPGGVAYLTVRRDPGTESSTQRRVVLELPEVVREAGGFVTYALSLRGWRKFVREARKSSRPGAR